MRNYKDEVIRAIRNGELDKFLSGDGKYYISYSEFFPAYMPTDAFVALKEGIYAAYEELSFVLELFEETIVRMSGGSEFYLYCAVLYYKLQLYYEKEHKAPFNINKIAIGGELFKAISKQTPESMSKIVDSHGIVFKSAWQDFVKWDKRIFMDENIHIM